MTPKDEWDKVIIPQFDKATQDKLQAWRKRSKKFQLKYLILGSALIGMGAFMVGISIGGMFFK